MITANFFDNTAIFIFHIFEIFSVSSVCEPHDAMTHNVENCVLNYLY